MAEKEEILMNKTRRHPTPDTAEFLSYLIRPMKQIEEKVEDLRASDAEGRKVLSSTIEKINQANMGVHDAIKAVDVRCNKLENRLGACEGLVKHIEPMREQVCNCEAVSKAQDSRLDEVEKSAKMMSARVNDLDFKEKSLDKRCSDQDKELHMMQGSMNDHKRKLDDLEAFRKKMEGDLFKHQEEVRVSFSNLDLHLEKCFKGIDQKSQNVSDYAERIEKQLRSHLDSCVKDLKAEMSSIMQNLSEIRSDFASRLSNLESLENDVRYEIELMEKRMDKLGIMVKEIKAEVGA